MQVSTNKYDIQLPGIQIRNAFSTGDFTLQDVDNNNSKSTEQRLGTSANYSYTANSTFPSLQANLAASTLDKASTTGSPDSQTVNPVNHLTASDIKLVEQATGATIVDGKVYEADGQPSPCDSEANDLIEQIYEARTFGTENSSGTGRLSINGDLTADEMKTMLDNAIKDNTSSNAKQTVDVLRKALRVLQSEGNTTAQS